jgi:tetratricopeptide (TPR) repeat protein
MAAAYEHIGNPGQAIEYYHKALSMNHGDAGVLSGLGKLYLNEGNRKEAVSYFRKALNLDENLVSIYPLLKDIYQKSGDTENAAKVEAMLLGVQKKNRSKSCYKSGMQAYLASNYMLAIDEFSKSIAYDATNTAALSDLAYAYYDLNQLERAFELHRRALAVNPKYANSYYGLALIYKKRGDLRAARENWGKYLDLEPNGYFSRKAVQEMEKIGRY